MSHQFFVGRRSEIELIKNAIKVNNSVLVYGEVGIGKSMMLENLYEDIKENKDIFVGFLNKGDSIEATSYIYPFVKVLSDLIRNIYSHKGEITNLGRLKDALGAIVSDSRGISEKISRAIIQSVLNTVINKLDTLDIVDVKAIRDGLGAIYNDLKTELPFDGAMSFINEHHSESIVQYDKILSNLSAKYPEKKIVFILDQFERFKDTPSTANFLIGTLRHTHSYSRNVIFVLSYEWPASDNKNTIFDNIKRAFFDEDGRMCYLKGLNVENIRELAEKLYLKINDSQIEIIAKKTGGFPLAINELFRDLPQNQVISDELINRLPNDKVSVLYDCYRIEFKKISKNNRRIAQILSLIEKNRLDMVLAKQLVLRCSKKKIGCESFWDCISDFKHRNFFMEYPESKISWFRNDLLQCYVREKEMEIPQFQGYYNCAAKFREECIAKLKDASLKLEECAPQ